MNNPQIQLKISLSDQLNDLLRSKATRLGIPVTQLVKYLIIKEVENEDYPTFQASDQTIKRANEAMSKINQAVDASDFFKKLNES
jgi:hypothetical protein